MFFTPVLLQEKTKKRICTEWRLPDYLKSFQNEVETSVHLYLGEIRKIGKELVQNFDMTSDTL